MSDVAVEKNADAQAEARRANYIATLEETGSIPYPSTVNPLMKLDVPPTTVTSLESMVLQLQKSGRRRESRSEITELRQENVCLRHEYREREKVWRAYQSGQGPDPGELPALPASFSPSPSHLNLNAARLGPLHPNQPGDSTMGYSPLHDNPDGVPYGLSNSRSLSPTTSTPPSSSSTSLTSPFQFNFSDGSVSHDRSGDDHLRHPPGVSIHQEAGTRVIAQIINFPPPDLDPVDQVALAIKLDTPDRLPSAYTALCQRDEALQLVEARKLGIETTVLVARARELLMKSSLSAAGATRLDVSQIERVVDEVFWPDLPVSSTPPASIQGLVHEHNVNFAQPSPRSPARFDPDLPASEVSLLLIPSSGGIRIFNCLLPLTGPRDRTAVLDCTFTSCLVNMRIRAPCLLLCPCLHLN